MLKKKILCTHSHIIKEKKFLKNYLKETHPYTQTHKKKLKNSFNFNYIEIFFLLVFILLVNYIVCYYVNKSSRSAEKKSPSSDAPKLRK